MNGTRHFVAGEKLTEWLKFFLAAGIDSAPAAEYAVSFVDNRIKKDMLSELDRECCREIGITALGDIMLVLKQAKKVINPVSWSIGLRNMSQ